MVGDTFVGLMGLSVFLSAHGMDDIEKEISGFGPRFILWVVQIVLYILASIFIATAIYNLAEALPN